MAGQIDWPAAVVVAGRLGIHSSRLVASRDAGATRVWALENARAFSIGPRAASYRQLATLVGPEPEAGGQLGPDDAIPA